MYLSSIYNLNSIRSNKHQEPISNNLIVPHFDNLESKIIDYISKSTYIIGCVAWLTNKNILNALENKKGTKIIVNKEEYLSSKMRKSNLFFYRSLRAKYDSLIDLFTINCECCNKEIIKCNQFKKIFGTLTENKKGSILTFGIVNGCSKLHHKFLIFFDKNLLPIGVWSGSYNLSTNSNFSLENALFITDLNVINEYIKEFKCIYEYSEEYDWKSGTLKLN